MTLQTKRLSLELQSPSEVLEWVEALPPEVRREISEEWLSRLKRATQPDPWSCLFKIYSPSSGHLIGVCGFKGPPDNNDAVEITYGIEEAYRNCGYATESVGALVRFAVDQPEIATLRAHTTCGNIASERVLRKSGFRLIGAFEDPDDGLVNRWECTTRVTHKRSLQ